MPRRKNVFLLWSAMIMNAWVLSLILLLPSTSCYSLVARHNYHHRSNNHDNVFHRRGRIKPRCSQLNYQSKAFRNPLRISKPISSTPRQWSTSMPISRQMSISPQSMSLSNSLSSEISTPSLIPIPANALENHAKPYFQGIATTLPNAALLSSTTIKTIGLWLSLFAFEAVLHSAEAAITKLSSWKIQELVEEDGDTSPFTNLSKNRNLLLSTILIGTTMVSIYSAALFVSIMSECFPTLSFGWSTAILTFLTLLFGEMLPKALAMANSELFARKLVPILEPVARLFSPVTSLMNKLCDKIIDTIGFRSVVEGEVSEDMLRLVVNEAQKSEGIKHDEGDMINAVLDLQSTTVGKIMQPRIEIVALVDDAPIEEVLKTAIHYRYSRIPVYHEDIDKIVGMVICKDLLSKVMVPGSFLSANITQYPDSSQKVTGALSDASKSSRDAQSQLSSTNSNAIKIDGKLTAGDIMEQTYFVPETMSLWTAMQELRKRRMQMAIVVDEYGGTAGLVTFEDILEQVVGDIYDEDEAEELADDSQTIFFDKGSGVVTIQGHANLDDVCQALDLHLDDEIKAEFNTISGFLCAHAKVIPKQGDIIRFSPYSFTITSVEDNRRIKSLLAVHEPSASNEEVLENTETVNSTRIEPVNVNEHSHVRPEDIENVQ